MDQTAGTPFDPDIATLIRRKAARLAKAIRDPATDAHDYEQQLASHLLVTLDGFDQALGSLRDFVNGRLQQKAADIWRAARAKRRRPDRPIVDIDAPADPDGCSGGRRCDGLVDVLASDGERRHRERDVREAEALLDEEERRVALMLRHGFTVNYIAGESGVSRNRITTIRGSIAMKFRSRGLDEYC